MIHCHSLKSESERRSVISDSWRPHGLYSPWNSPGQNTGVGSLSLLQGIFPTQGLNPGLPHCRWILYQLSHKGSPRILEWVAYPFSSGSSWPRNGTRVSCVTSRFFTNWAMREALKPVVYVMVHVCCCIVLWILPNALWCPVSIVTVSYTVGSLSPSAPVPCPHLPEVRWRLHERGCQASPWAQDTIH